ncbi:MAG: hypothetical protein HOM37_10055 [Acidimicrobiaceae bacterium]|jgi:hypothetical protein|nr:hypothetical protein [Acidimicrobiaceae bacterium]MBT5581057.1 hypothetical protein [Acidimicrobiaceae bacterium]MDG1412278.1 hypothetical protein [Acidimicrobiales bacterium]MDG2219033.1 hypothetical protein [Acidimicrobiales bacterium]
MGMNDLEITIRSMREDVDGDVCSRSRVMDALLDLRLEAGGRHDILAEIDRALADLPGKNMVPATWWREQLDSFEMVAINPVETVG